MNVPFLALTGTNIIEPSSTNWWLPWSGLLSLWMSLFSSWFSFVRCLALFRSHFAMLTQSCAMLFPCMDFYSLTQSWLSSMCSCSVWRIPLHSRMISGKCSLTFGLVHWHLFHRPFKLWLRVRSLQTCLSVLEDIPMNVWTATQRRTTLCSLFCLLVFWF